MISEGAIFKLGESVGKSQGIDYSPGLVTVGRAIITPGPGWRSKRRGWLLEPGRRKIMRGSGPHTEELSSSVEGHRQPVGSPATL